MWLRLTAAKSSCRLFSHAMRPEAGYAPRNSAAERFGEANCKCGEPSGKKSKSIEVYLLMSQLFDNLGRFHPTRETVAVTAVLRALLFPLCKSGYSKDISQS